MDRTLISSFGYHLKLSADDSYGGMTAAQWKQTAMDLPLVAAASGVGWGLGKTLADEVARRNMGPSPTQGYSKYAPAIGSMLAAAAGYTAGRMRGSLSERRAQAEGKTASFGEWLDRKREEARGVAADKARAGNERARLATELFTDANKERLIGLYMKKGPSLDDYHLDAAAARPPTTMTRAQAESHYNSKAKSPSGG